MLQNLITARKDAGLTQTETAKRIGITTRQYLAIERGQSDGSIKVWKQLKDLFHEPIDYLLEEVTDTHRIAQNEPKGQALK